MSVDSGDSASVGLGEGLGLGDSAGEGDGVAEGESVSLGVGVGVFFVVEALADGVLEADAVAVALTDGLAVVAAPVGIRLPTGRDRLAVDFCPVR